MEVSNEYEHRQFWGDGCNDGDKALDEVGRRFREVAWATLNVEMNRILKEFGLEKYCVSEEKSINNTPITPKEREELLKRYVEQVATNPKGVTVKTSQSGKKQITMSLETAKGLYKDLCTRTDIASVNFKNWLLENFTKEELEPVVVPEPKKEGFTWEESFDRDKKQWDASSGMVVAIEPSSGKNTINWKLFKTEKQALSALAFAQLSHICAKYNEGKKPGKTKYSVACSISGGLCLTDDFNRVNHIPFCTKEDAETSLRVNRKLWEQYWMISE